MDEQEAVQLHFHRLELELYRLECGAMGLTLERGLEAAVRVYFINMLTARKRQREEGGS